MTSSIVQCQWFIINGWCPKYKVRRETRKSSPNETQPMAMKPRRREKLISTANETHPGQQLATETPVDRETHRQQMNIFQQQRLDTEMREERFQQDMKLHKE